MSEIQIADRLVGSDHPTYFIADISANHDGDLDPAEARSSLTAGGAGELDPRVPTRKTGAEAFRHPSLSREVHAAGLITRTGPMKTPGVAIRGGSHYV